MKGTNNPSALRSQEEITEALMTLMRKYPYSEITVKQIILEAKLARKTFYRNFDSKDDVLCSVIRGVLREYFEIVDSRRGEVLPTIFSTAEKYRELLLILDKNNMLHMTLYCINEYVPRLRSEKMTGSNPFIRLFEGANPEYLMALNIGAAWNVIALWIHKGMTDAPEQVMLSMEKYFQNMAESRAGLQKRGHDTDMSNKTV